MTFSLIAPSVGPRSSADQPNIQARARSLGAFLCSSTAKVPRMPARGLGGLCGPARDMDRLESPASNLIANRKRNNHHSIPPTVQFVDCEPWSRRLPGVSF